MQNGNHPVHEVAMSNFGGILTALGCIGVTNLAYVNNILPVWLAIGVIVLSGAVIKYFLSGAVK